MRSCLAIEFSHQFDSKYYIGTFADNKPSLFETQTNATQIFKSCQRISSVSISIESHMGNKRNFRTDNSKQQQQYIAANFFIIVVARGTQNIPMNQSATL